MITLAPPAIPKIVEQVTAAQERADEAWDTAQRALERRRVDGPDFELAVARYLLMWARNAQLTVDLHVDELLIAIDELAPCTCSRTRRPGCHLQLVDAGDDDGA